MEDFHGNRTLDDIESYDIDNLQYILKNKKVYTFHQITECVKFSGEALDKALTEFGISLEAAASYSNSLGDPEHDRVGNTVDKMLKEKDVRVEQRMEYTGQDQWRCGIYIYHSNEIVAFLGAPRREETTLGIPKYVIETTVRL